MLRCTDAVTFRSLFWDWLLGRIAPVLLFAGAALVQALAATVAQPEAGESLRGTLHFAQACGSLFFFVLLTLAYVTRLPRRTGRREPLVVLVVLLTTFGSVAGAALPRRPNVALDVAGLALVALGTGYSLWAMTHLRRAFSILPEARSLVTTGPYALSRHPLYLAETIAMLGVVLPLADARLFLVLPFVFGQWLRLGWEEGVLASEFPQYAEYASRVPRYFPWFRRSAPPPPPKG